MTRIYLIRHAEAEGNLYRIAHGHEEGLITDYRGPPRSGPWPSGSGTSRWTPYMPVT